MLPWQCYVQEAFGRKDAKNGHKIMVFAPLTEGKNPTLVGTIPFCGEYPSPRFEDKFPSANQIDGISMADRGKMADS